MSVATLTADLIFAHTYGAATERIRSIIQRGGELRWFEKPTTSDVARARSLAMRHLRALHDASIVTSLPLTIEVVKGDRNTLAELFVTANAVTSDDMYRRGAWRAVLGEMTLRAERRLAAPDRAALLRPPLFPEGRPMILGGMLTNAETAARKIPQSHRDIVWSLMCDTDRDFWSAVLWLLADCDCPNPFLPLLDLYELMLYPIGFVTERFVIFYRDE